MKTVTNRFHLNSTDFIFILHANAHTCIVIRLKLGIKSLYLIELLKQKN